jgi:hypothetical protein
VPLVLVIRIENASRSTLERTETVTDRDRLAFAGIVTGSSSNPTETAVALGMRVYEKVTEELKLFRLRIVIAVDPALPGAMLRCDGEIEIAKSRLVVGRMSRKKLAGRFLPA